jgi:hypothetical protein
MLVGSDLVCQLLLDLLLLLRGELLHVHLLRQLRLTRVLLLLLLLLLRNLNLEELGSSELLGVLHLDPVHVHHLAVRELCGGQAGSAVGGGSLRLSLGLCLRLSLRLGLGLSLSLRDEVLLLPEHQLRVLHQLGILHDLLLELLLLLLDLLLELLLLLKREHLPLGELLQLLGVELCQCLGTQASGRGSLLLLMLLLLMAGKRRLAVLLLLQHGNLLSGKDCGWLRRRTGIREVPHVLGLSRMVRLEESLCFRCIQ